eukprot:Filipodium_phascolosomae@DN636_c0_g1_i1.p1
MKRLQMGAFSFICLSTFKEVSLFHYRSRGGDVPPVSMTGGRSRSEFMSLLFFSNFARVVMLLTALFVQANPKYLQIWVLYILRSFPSMIFLSTYSVIILFWAQVYCAASLRSNIGLRAHFCFLNGAAYSIYFLAAALLYYYEQFLRLVYFEELLIGSLYLLVGSGFAYYGMKVANRLSERVPDSQRKKSILQRVIILCVCCPALFLSRGLYGVAFGTRLLRQYYPSVASKSFWDFLVFSITEFFPSLLILFVFSNRNHPSDGNRSLQNSDERDLEEARSTAVIQNGLSETLNNWEHSPYRKTFHQPGPTVIAAAQPLIETRELPN